MAGVIYDQNGNIVGTSIDTSRFITDKEGNIINPSTDDLLNNIKNILNNSNDEKLSNLAKESTLEELNNKIISNSSGVVVTTQSPIQVSALSLPLPNNAATESTLSNINNKIENTQNGIKVDGSGVVQPISADSLPLPDGAAKDLTLIDGSQKTKIVDSNNNVVGVYSDSLNVNIKSIQADIDLNYDSDEVTIYGKNGNDHRAISVDNTGAINVNVITSELPNNAATEYTLNNINSKIPSDLPTENGNIKDIRDNIEYIKLNLGNLAQNNTLNSIDSKLKTNIDDVIKVDASDYTMNITAQSLPLPIGASTEAKQSQILDKLIDIENYIGSEYTLSLINQKLTSNNGHLIVDASQHTIPTTIVSGIGYNSSSITIYGQSQSSKQPISVDENGKLNVNINDVNITNKIDTSNSLLNFIKTQTDKLSFNSDRLKVDANISMAPEVEITNDSGNPIPISAASLPLPDGAATSAKQDTTNNILTGVKSQTDKFTFNGDRLKVDADITIAPEVEIKNDAGNPIPISASSLPLPAGAATSLKQDTTNNLLTSINDNTSKFVFNGTRLLTEAVITSSVEVEVKNDVGNPVSVNGSVLASQNGQWNINNITGTISLPTGASTESTLSNLNSKIGEVQNNPTQYTLLDRVKSIYTALYDIFSGIRLLGWIKKRNDFSNNVIYSNTINLAANASSAQINIGTVPVGQKWHILYFGLGRAIINTTNNTAISRVFLRKNGSNIFIVSSDGNYCQADVGITFVAGETLSYLVTNGNTASDNYINIVYEVENI